MYIYLKHLHSMLLKVNQKQKESNRWFTMPERWQKGMRKGVRGVGGRREEVGKIAKEDKSMISIATSGRIIFFLFVFSVFSKFSTLSIDYTYIMKRTQHIF